MTHHFQKAPTLEEHIKKVLEQSSGSVLHHWVPQFLMRQFTDEPQAENPSIWCMSVHGGHSRLSCVRDECAIKGHNLLVDSDDLPETAIEGLYAYMEVLAAPIVRTLLAGGDLDPEERSALSMFFAMQEQRTPRSRSNRRYCAAPAPDSPQSRTAR